MEPRVCLSSTPVRGKECLWVPASGRGAPVDLFHALSVGQQEGQIHRLCFLSLLSTSTWHISWNTEGKTEEWRREIPHPKSVLWRSRCVISGANSLTLDHLQSLIHPDSSPMTLLFCKLKTLCTLLTMHSVTSWLAGRLATVNWLVLDWVQPHSSCCDLKAYLH